MTAVVLTHAVGNMDTWLGGGNSRKTIFGDFCSSYRIFKHPDANSVAVVFEGVDLVKMNETLGSSETEAAKAAHTVMEPIEIYIEIDGSE